MLNHIMVVRRRSGLMNNKKYTLKTNFNPDWESDDMELKRPETFEKKLELLCLEYNVDIDWDYDG